MHRSLPLAFAIALAAVPHAAAIYDEDAPPEDRWHDLAFEVREADGELELVLVAGNLSQLLPGHHVNITVDANVSAAVDFTFRTRGHGNDTAEQEPTSVVLAEFTVQPGAEGTGQGDIPQDALGVRFEATDGAREAAVDHEMLVFSILETGNEGEPVDGGAEEDPDPAAGDDKGSPGPGVLLVALALLAGVAIARRNK